MKTIMISIVAGVFLVLPVFTACSAEKQTGQVADAKALFEKKCSTCHSSKKATGQKKNQAEWADTVMRMKNKNGAPVNDDEAKSITEYLAKNYGK